MDTLVKIKSINHQMNSSFLLSNISFHLSKGQCLLLLGPNGAGKTSTLNFLLGKYSSKTSLNQMSFENHQLSRKDRLSFGFMPSDEDLCQALTLYEFLKFHLAIYKPQWSQQKNKDHIREQLKSVSLLKQMHQPIGYLSYGQKRRFAFICSVIHEPKVLILDEPFNGQDPKSKVIMRESIQSCKKNGAGILLATHLPEWVEGIYDFYLFFRQGAIVQRGESLSNCQNFMELFDENTSDAHN